MKLEQCEESCTSCLDCRKSRLICHYPTILTIGAPEVNRTLYTAHDQLTNSSRTPVKSSNSPCKTCAFSASYPSKLPTSPAQAGTCVEATNPLHGSRRECSGKGRRFNKTHQSRSMTFSCMPSLDMQLRTSLFRAIRLSLQPQQLNIAVAQ